MSVRTPRTESTKTPIWPPDAMPAFHHPDAERYLRARGVEPEEAEKYALSYCERGRWAKRIIIPFMSETGGLLGFQGRIITPDYDKEDKYLTEGIRPLYCPWDYRRAAEPFLMIVEGPFDYFAMNRFVPTAATLGYRPSERQFLDILNVCMTHN